jgi:hypothetical protein
MKLRFRKNSLRLRLNQREVSALASGQALEERVEFPGGTALVYKLMPRPNPEPAAQFIAGAIEISIPNSEAVHWDQSESIGLYYHLGALDIAIEKDLECTDATTEEQDPFAYPRKVAC